MIVNHINLRFLTSMFPQEFIDIIFYYIKKNIIIIIFLIYLFIFVNFIYINLNNFYI